MSKAAFVGSFNPFTIGHDRIVRRAARMFGSVVIGVVGDQVNKPGMPSAEERAATIRACYAGETGIEVKTYYGLAVDFARQEGATCIVKGVRNVRDFEYEREQADINRRIADVDTVLLMAEPEVASVSSSMVRELRHFGVDTAPFLPNIPADKNDNIQR